MIAYSHSKAGCLSGPRGRSAAAVATGGSRGMSQDEAGRKLPHSSTWKSRCVNIPKAALVCGRQARERRKR